MLHVGYAWHLGAQAVALKTASIRTPYEDGTTNDGDDGEYDADTDEDDEADGYIGSPWTILFAFLADRCSSLTGATGVSNIYHCPG